MKPRILIFTFIFLAGGMLFAQSKGKKKEMHQEIRSYVEKNVFPVMEAQRSKLDLVLNSSDQAKLDEIRNDLKAHRESSKPLFKEMKKLRQSENEPTDEQKNQMRALHKERRLIMNEAWEIADKYETEIYALLDEVKPQADVWKKDLRSIHENYRPEGAGEGNGPRHQRGHGHHGRHGGRQHHGMKGGGPVKMLHSPVAFLIWDGEMREMDAPFEDAEDIKVSPNPGQISQKLSYEVQEQGNVVILLIDTSGNPVRQVLNENQSAGSYAIDVNLEGLKEGIYFYQISTATGTSTKKISIE